MQYHFMNALITWRLTYMLMNERAPYAILDKVREYIANKSIDSKELVHDNFGHPRMVTTQRGFWYELNEGLLCKFCTSVWVGLAVALVTKQNILYGFAYSAGALLFGAIFEKMER